MNTKITRVSGEGRVAGGTQNAPTALDLFCGAGGFSHGLRLAGFKVVAATDCWDAAAATYQANHPQAQFIGGDICDPAVKEAIIAACNHGIDVITGGPPCQSFSTSGRRDPNDSRDSLAEEYLDLVSRLEPKCYVLENVSGLRSKCRSDGRKVIEVIEERFGRLGYPVEHAIVNAVLHGVPQNRRRLILIASRKGRFDFDTLARSHRPVTFRDAVSDLPEVAATNGETIAYQRDPQNKFQMQMRDSTASLTEHMAPRHDEKLKRMMEYLGEGESAMDATVRQRMPAELWPNKAFPNSYSRIFWDRPAPTITRNFACVSSANCIHPSQPRGLTVREAARCQSFRE